MRRSKPIQVEQLLVDVLDELGLEEAARAHRLGQCWEEAVGPEIAAHCQPAGLRDGMLEAQVESSVWAQQLQLRGPEILASLRELLGDEAPTALRFRVGYAPSERSKP